MPNSDTFSAPARSLLSDDEIRRRIEACPKLASLQSINRALTSLVDSEQSMTSQIAGIIRRDPSLSARLLRMVNSVYFGLSSSINNIEDAVFFLGLRQIRELSRATPIIEDLARMQSQHFGPEMWSNLWSHSLATAILTREILSCAAVTTDDETDYLAGLLHNLGKIVMAHAFPEELMTVASTPVRSAAEVCALERELIGWDHAEIGGYFLGRHRLADEIVVAVRHHNEPDKAPRHAYLPAAVQVADHLARHAGVASGFEQVEKAEEDTWTDLPGWKILYGEDPAEWKIARAEIANTLQRLPTMLGGVV